MADDQADASGKYGMNGRGPQGAARYWPWILKVIELIICVVCIGLIDDPANNSHHKQFVTQRVAALSYATFASYLIISAVFLIGKLVRDNWPWKTSALLSLIAFILYTACAASLIKDWSQTKERNYWPPNATRLDLVCATGFISLIGAIVFLVDLILTIRSGLRGDLGE